MESSQIYLSNANEVIHQGPLNSFHDLKRFFRPQNILSGPLCRRSTLRCVVCCDHESLTIQRDSFQIPEFATLEDRLENSLQRDLMKMEHVRMRLAHEVINTELIDMELIELKFIFDRRELTFGTISPLSNGS